MSGDDYTIGKGKPPRSTRFPPKVSGFYGRRKRRYDQLPHEDVLGRVIQIIEDGELKNVSAEVGFLKKSFSLASKKGGRVRRYVLEAMDRGKKSDQTAQRRPIHYALMAEPGDVAQAMRSAGMATLLHPILPSAKYVMEPWLVNEALGRLGDRRLSEAQQMAVVAATRRPHAVRWPNWWTVSYK